MATETKEFPVYRRAIGFASMPSEVYEYLKENDGINEGTLYHIKDTHQLYKGYDLLTQQIETIDDATVAVENAMPGIFYVDANGRLATMINGEWVVLSKGNTLDISDIVMDKGQPVASAVSGKAVKEYVDASIQFVTDVTYEETAEKQDNGSSIRKYYLVINKNKTAGGTESRIDLTPFMDATPEEERTLEFAKPILPNDIYYITGAQSSIYTHNMFKNADAADTVEVAIIGTDAESETQHTYITDKYSAYIQDETAGVIKNTIGTTDKAGHEYTSDVIFHSSNLEEGAGYKANIQFIGDSLFYQRGTESKSVPGMLIKELKESNITLTPVGTKGDQESCNYWTLETVVGANTYMEASPKKEVYPGGVNGSTPYNTRNMFLRLATSKDYTNTPEKCFEHTSGGKVSESSYADSTNKGTGKFYIFDYNNYLTNYIGNKPDIVVIGMGNELTPISADPITGTNQYDLTRAMTALEIMVDSIKEALPNVKIGIATPIAKARNIPKDIEWNSYTANYIETLIAKVSELQTKYDGLYLIPLYLHVDRNFNFVPTSQKSKYTGTIDTKKGTYTESDLDHILNDNFLLTNEGRSEVLAALKGWILSVATNV